MRKYHILFNKTGHEIYSTGVNIIAENLIEAISIFHKHYPNAMLLSLHDLDAIDLLHIDRTSIQKDNKDIV